MTWCKFPPVWPHCRRASAGRTASRISRDCTTCCMPMERRLSRLSGERSFVSPSPRSWIIFADSFSTILLPAGAEYPGSHGQTLVSGSPVLITPCRIYRIYPLSVLANASVVKSTAARSMVNCPLKPAAWMILCPLSISHRLARSMLRIH